MKLNFNSGKMKLPPIEKIAEAYSAIDDNRISEENENTYIVTSSNKEKTYKVTINNNLYRSNDNATKFARYAGYPIIAVLMFKKLLPIPNQYLQYFKDINWNEINKKYKRDYALALDHILAEKNIPDDIILKIKESISECYDKFISLNIKI